MGAALPALIAVGAITSAGSALFGGIAQGRAASYQAQVARNNAIVADQNARQASAAGAEKATEESLKNRAVLGRIRAGIAASGIDVNSGSAVDVQASQREKGQLDTETTEHNAILQAYGYRSQAVTEQAQAGLEQAQVGPDIAGGVLSAGGTLLEHASNLAFNWGGSTDSSLYQDGIAGTGGAGTTATGVDY